MNAGMMTLSRNGLVELNDNEIREVSGGVAAVVVGATFLAVCAVAAAGLGVFTAAEAAGEAIGKAVYNASH